MEIPFFIDDAGHVFVQESDYANLVTHVRDLVLDQKNALRSHDPAAIDNCRQREAALLSFASQYLVGRAKHPNIKK